MMPKREILGREKYLSVIRAGIDDFGKKRVISIHGRGGVGKTYLLLKIHEEYISDNSIVCHELVDFSQSKSRTKRWLMDSIAQKTPGAFETYYQTLKQLDQQRSPEIRAVQQKDLEEIFFEEFKTFERENRNLFLFDTLELIQDTLLISFVLDLAQLSNNSVFCLAGRRNAELDEGPLHQNFTPSEVIQISLGGFDEETSREFVCRDEIVGKDLNEDEVLALHLLSEGGLPIKLVLALDWLSRGYVMKTLATASGDALNDLLKAAETNAKEYFDATLAFEKELVTKIAELGRDIDHLVYLMAHVSRRFNRELIACLIPNAEVLYLVEALKKLGFVKFIDADYFVLHDEIQRMIMVHIWEWRDPDGSERRDISQKVVEYYAHKLDSLGSGEIELRNIYLIEQLHYKLDVDLVSGYQEFERIFDTLYKSHREVELAVLAINVVRDHSLPLPLREYINTYYQGWILIGREQLEMALSVLGKGINQLEQLIQEHSDYPEFVRDEVFNNMGRVYTELGFCYKEMGNWAKAVEYYDRARKENQDQLDRLMAQDPVNETIINDQRSQLAESLNDLANVSRKYGNMPEARKYCKASLLIRESLGETVRIGHCCYVMGMIMWEIGNTSEAIAYLERARNQYQAGKVDHFEKAWIDRYEGYVLYRIGNFDDARTMLLRSLEATRNSQSFQDDYAEVLLLLSRINRDEKKYDLSLQQASNALEIATRIPNNYRITEALLTLSLTILATEGEESPRFREYFDQGRDKASMLAYRRLEVIFADVEADLAFKLKDYDKAFKKYIYSCNLALEFKYAVYARQLSNLSSKLQTLAIENPVRAGGICNRLIHEWKQVYDLNNMHPEFVEEIQYIYSIAEKNGQLQELEERYKNDFVLGKWDDLSTLLQDIESQEPYLYPARAKAFLYRAELSYTQSRYSGARLYCERAHRIISVIDNRSKILGDCYFLLGRIYWKLGNTAEANDVLIKAEDLYRQNDYDLGVGQVESIRAYIYFRTQRYEDAYNKLSKAIEVYENYNQKVSLSRAYNMLSRLVRTTSARNYYDEQTFLEAEQFAQKAERVLGGQSKYVESEINLTFGILYYQWSKRMKEQKLDESEKKLDLAVQRLQNSWEISRQLDIPILASVYHGMMGNIMSLKGEPYEAIQYFVKELSFARYTKEKRLLWSLNLFEDWLMKQPFEVITDYVDFFAKEWEKEKIDGELVQVIEILKWFATYQKYIRPWGGIKN